MPTLDDRLDDRRKYIGGGDACALLGLNDYDSVLKLFRKKIGEELDDPENFHMERGNIIEPIVEQWVKENADGSVNGRRHYEEWCPEILPKYDRAALERESGIDSRPPQIAVVHPDMPYVGGHPDGVGDETIWEFKAPAPRSLGYILKEGVNKCWMYQVQHYLFCTGKPKGVIAVWDFDKWEPILFPVTPNAYIHDHFAKVYPYFWHHVKMGIPPAPWSEPVSEHFRHISDPELDRLCEMYEEAKARRYEGEDQQSRVKGTLLSVLDGPGRVETDNWYINASEYKRYGSAYVRLIVRPKNPPAES